MARGAFITLEGGEGAGKSTQMERLASHLEERGLSVVMTREPGGTPQAEGVRDLLVKGAVESWDALSEALLLFAARRNHTESLIKPALAAGRWVISDRFFDSTLVYQGVAGGAGREKVDALRRLALGDFAPDLTLILDLPAEEGLRRAEARIARGPAEPENRFENKGLAYHRKLRAAYKDIIAGEPRRCVLIDATAREEDVAKEIRAAVKDRLGERLP